MDHIHKGKLIQQNESVVINQATWQQNAAKTLN